MGRINSLDLLAMVFLMHSRRMFAFFAMRAHSWLTVYLLPTQIPRASSTKLLPPGWSPVCTGALGYSSTAQGFAFPFVELCKAPVSWFLSFAAWLHTNIISPFAFLLCHLKAAEIPVVRSKVWNLISYSLFWKNWLKHLLTIVATMLSPVISILVIFVFDIFSPLSLKFSDVIQYSRWSFTEILHSKNIFIPLLKTDPLMAA